MIRKHTTCLDVSQLQNLPEREYICGPDCPVTPGAAAYDVWRDQANSLVAFTVDRWRDLGPVSQEIWERIATAAIEKCEYMSSKNEQEPCDTCSGMGCAECLPM